MSTVVAPWGVPCSGCRVPQLVGRFPPPLYKQLQNIPNQTKAAAQNTLPCSVLRPFFVSSASQLLQDILDLFVGVALLQQLAPDGRIAPALTVEACGAVGHDHAPRSQHRLPARDARTLCPGICRGLLGTLGRLGLLERPLALGNVQLLAGDIVVELLLTQGVLILPLGQLVLVLLLGQTVLPLVLLHLLAPRSISTLGLIGAAYIL